MKHVSRRRHRTLINGGIFLAKRRVAKGLSQAALAVLLGIRHVSVSRVECGQRRPPPALILPWSAALDLDPSEIMHRYEDLEYETAVNRLGETFRAANPALAQGIWIVFGAMALDAESRRAVLRACLMARKDQERRMAG